MVVIRILLTLLSSRSRGDLRSPEDQDSLAKGEVAKGEGFEPPRAWRPLRFSRSASVVSTGAFWCYPGTS